MEVFVVLALVAAASVASADPIDWSQVVPVHDLPQFHHKYPQLNRRHHEPYKIFGGEEARPGQFPYMVACLLQTPQITGFCGGSILSNEFVLTAAHCIDVLGAYDFSLIFGAHDITANEPSQIVVKPVAWVIHADWNRSILENDIAVFRVPQIQFNDRIQPIRLPSRSQQSNSFAGESATSSGWGLTSHDVSSPVLRFVEQPIITNLMCNFIFDSLLDSSLLDSFLLDSHICVGGEGGRGSCRGDSGGPLIHNENDGLPTQVGINSFGAEGCEDGYPSVFTRVTLFLDWIQANTDVIIRP